MEIHFTRVSCPFDYELQQKKALWLFGKVKIICDHCRYVQTLGYGQAYILHSWSHSLLKKENCPSRAFM